MDVAGTIRAETGETAVRINGKISNGKGRAKDQDSGIQMRQRSTHSRAIKLQWPAAMMDKKFAQTAYVDIFTIHAPPLGPSAKFVLPGGIWPECIFNKAEISIRTGEVVVTTEDHTRAAVFTTISHNDYTGGPPQLIALSGHRQTSLSYRQARPPDCSADSPQSQLYALHLQSKARNQGHIFRAVRIIDF